MANPVFQKNRNVELSCIEYLTTQINASWTGVTTVKSFQNTTRASLPVVCIRLLGATSVTKEIGATTLVDTYNIVIDIFAKSDGQRLDLADFILGKLKDGYIYYEFSHASGDYSTVNKTENGRVHFVGVLENSRVDFGEVEVAEEDKYRHILSLLIRKI